MTSVVHEKRWEVEASWDGAKLEVLRPSYLVSVLLGAVFKIGTFLLVAFTLNP